MRSRHIFDSACLRQTFNSRAANSHQKEGPMQRKAQFFTIDAIVALAVLGIGIVILYLSYQGEPLQVQTSLYAGDLMDFFTGTNFDELGQDWAINLWCDQGPRCTTPTHEIAQPHQPIIGVLAALVQENKLGLARNVTENVSKGLVQPQFNWNLSISTESSQVLLYERALAGQAAQRVATRGIFYYTSKEHNLEGPYVATILVWQ
jgi:hypothetical protein